MQLDRQLAAWKESIERAGTLTEEDILELEMHVRESVRELTEQGLTQDEALLVALRRIGDPSVLALEYRKVKPRLGWAVRSTLPFVGLLGITMGVVNAISGLAAAGSGGLAALSAGIAEALITTAFGLFVAVPAVSLYNHFTTRRMARS